MVDPDDPTILRQELAALRAEIATLRKFIRIL
jgi:hypothetical protein